MMSKKANKRVLLAGLCAGGALSAVLGAGRWAEAVPAYAESSLTETEISLTGIQLRAPGLESPWYTYLVLLSPSYAEVAANEEVASGLANSDLSGIRLYTVSEDGELAGNAITPNHIETTKWGQPGGFIGFDEFKDGLDGEKVYKAFIPKGTKIAVSSTQAFVVDKDYTFFNKNYGNAEAKLESNDWAATPCAPYTDVCPELSLTGVQMRCLDGVTTNDYYNYLVLISSSHEGMLSAENLENGLLYSDLSGIRLYTVGSDGELVGNAITPNHLAQNWWGQPGAFIAFNEYSQGVDGASVYKIYVPKGTKLFLADAEKGQVYSVDQDYAFYNVNYRNEEKKGESLDWSPTPSTPPTFEETEISLTGIQLRAPGLESPWYTYLVLLSPSYAEVAASEEVASGLANSDLSGIRLYTVSEDGELVGNAITPNHIETTKWGQPGGFIGFDEFKDGLDGEKVYKAFIPKGTKIAVSSTQAFVIDRDYTFYNTNYGNEKTKLESFSWQETALPYEVENTGSIHIRGVTNQSDGDSRWLIVYLDDKQYPETNKDGTFYDALGLSNVLDKIYLYSSSDISKEPIKLRDIFTGFITLGQFSSKDALGFTIKNDESVNGTNLYAVSIEEGCEIPLEEDGAYTKRTVASKVTFLNNNYGKSGDIPGETGKDKRTYEDWSIDWSKGAFLTYTVVGADLHFQKVCLPVGSQIDASSFALDGYEVTIQDNLGYTYYEKIIVPESDAVITLTYSKKTIEPEEKPEESSSNWVVWAFVGGGAALGAGLVAVFVVVIKKKKA